MVGTTGNYDSKPDSAQMSYRSHAASRSVGITKVIVEVARKLTLNATNVKVKNERSSTSKHT